VSQNFKPPPPYKCWSSFKNDKKYKSAAKGAEALAPYKIPRATLLIKFTARVRKAPKLG